MSKRVKRHSPVGNGRNRRPGGFGTYLEALGKSAPCHRSTGCVDEQVRIDRVLRPRNASLVFSRSGWF